MTALTPLQSRPAADFLFKTAPILQTHDLAIGYAGRPVRLVLDQINVSLRSGELVCLIGPNGAGKSTLMRTLAGMQPPLRGSVTLMGDDVHTLPARDLARRLSVVLTERVNPGLLTASTLVALGRHPYTDWSGHLNVRDKAVVRQAIADVGAESLADRQVGELSDGERQKIMIARALAQEPALMILDEPTAFLDLPRRVEMMQLLRRLAHDSQRAILLSTHDLDLALRTADRIWLMPSGEPLQVGAPEDLVLSGAFETAFRTEGVTFDTQTGAFRLHSETQGRVALSGDGLPALWTKRALERAGFTVVSSGETALAHIEVESARWRLNAGSEIEEYDSLYDLIEAMQGFKDG
ncbi:MAG: ATP-binding cassette domain-containing protein [Chloroflexi bacterium]|nr:ATP-binding cassette domain-containing protein [Chloroflexota bacterium]